LNEWERENIASALSWIGRRRRVPLLSLDFLRELQRRMFARTWRWAGKFRTTVRTIGVSPEQIHERLVNLLDDTRYQVDEDSMSPDEIGVRFPHRLVAIHPFPNGNGRHTRMMTDLLLKELGAESFTWGSARLEVEGSGRDQYVAALKAPDAGEYEILRRFVRT
jgi:Fic-DOC domain mobile mystery protein B